MINITKDQLVDLINRLASSAGEWNDAMEDGDRGRGNNPLIIVIYDDSSGCVASSVDAKTLNVQSSFSNATEAADYLIEYHEALESDE